MRTHKQTRPSLDIIQMRLVRLCFKFSIEYLWLFAYKHSICVMQAASKQIYPEIDSHNREAHYSSLVMHEIHWPHNTQPPATHFMIPHKFWLKTFEQCFFFFISMWCLLIRFSDSIVLSHSVHIASTSKICVSRFVCFAPGISFNT